MPRPHTAEALSVDDCRLSVRPSVCPVPDSTSRTEGHSKLKTGRKEAHDIGDVIPFTGSFHRYHSNGQSKKLHGISCYFRARIMSPLAKCMGTWLPQYRPYSLLTYTIVTLSCPSVRIQCFTAILKTACLSLLLDAAYNIEKYKN